MLFSSLESKVKVPIANNVYWSLLFFLFKELNNNVCLFCCANGGSSLRLAYRGAARYSTCLLVAVKVKRDDFPVRGRYDRLKSNRHLIGIICISPDADIPFLEFWWVLCFYVVSMIYGYSSIQAGIALLRSWLNHFHSTYEIREVRY